MWYFGLHCLLPKIKKICISFWVASENNSKRHAQVSKAPCLGNLIQEFFYAAIIHGIREGTEAPSLWTPLREHATQNPFCTPNPSCFRLLSLLCLGTTGGCRTQGLYFVKYHDWAPEEGFRDSRLEESFASPIRWSNEIKENTVHLRKLTLVVYRDVTAGFGAQEAHTVSPPPQPGHLLCAQTPALPRLISEQLLDKQNGASTACSPTDCHALTGIPSVVPATRECLWFTAERPHWATKTLLSGHQH